MKLNIQIELDIEEFSYADGRLEGVLDYIAKAALESTGAKEMTDINLLVSPGKKKIGWWCISDAR